MRYENWTIRGFTRDDAVSLCNNGINPLVAVLLASRGITAHDKAVELLDAHTSPLHDPYLMADMDKAVARIRKAVDNHEYIAIYGDYDVDGMTSAAMLALWLGSQGVKYEVYIPGRFDEGYGLHTEALDTLKAHGAQLVITVDCGITAVQEAQYASSLGLDLVITDHHECPEELPEAAAVVNPKRHDCNYPFKLLAGAGVVYKLICALESNDIPGSGIDRYGQLAAIGTVADVMPVLGENRRLVIQGLRLLSINPVPGIYSLLGENPAEPADITASTISYVLAPRLNAAGRMGDPMLSVRLLLSRDSLEAKQYAEELSRLNTERRNLEMSMLDDAIARIEAAGKPVQTGPIVLAGTDWHQGVTGIVAAKISERYNLPAIILSIDNAGIGHGSCRSFGSFNIYDALCFCTDLLETFGGHEMAAGVTVAECNIDELRRRITEYYKTHTDDIPQPGLEVDFEVEKPELLTLQNIAALKQLEPFGRGNPPPCLCIKNAVLIDVISVGAGRHTKLKVGKSGCTLECIIFSVSSDELGAAAGDIVDVAFEPQINEFRGRRTVQLQLADIRKCYEN